MSSPPTDHARWFAEEVQPHESSLRRYLRGGFPLLPDIDDLVQESYARLIRAREAGRVGYASARLLLIRAAPPSRPPTPRPPRPLPRTP